MDFGLALHTGAGEAAGVLGYFYKIGLEPSYLGAADRAAAPCAAAAFGVYRPPEPGEGPRPRPDFKNGEISGQFPLLSFICEKKTGDGYLIFTGGRGLLGFDSHLEMAREEKLGAILKAIAAQRRESSGFDRAATLFALRALLRRRGCRRPVCVFSCGQGCERGVPELPAGTLVLPSGLTAGQKRERDRAAAVISYLEANEDILLPSVLL